MTTNPPVVTHRKWRHLLRAIAAIPQWRFISSMTEREARFALGAPTALARWIATQQPDFLDRPSLRVIVAGAELLDTVDDGMWYASLPALLGRPDMTVDVSLVGMALGAVPVELHDEIDGPFRTSYFGRVQNPCSGHLMSLSEFLHRHEETPDIVALFHPGFSSAHQTWFADDVLHQLVRRGIPVFATSMQDDDYVMDRMVLEAHGFAQIGDPVQNPFMVETERDIAYFAKWMWRFPTQVPARLEISDPKSMERVEMLDMIVADGIERGRMNEIERLGVLCELNLGSGPEKLISMPFGHWLDPHAGTIYIETADGFVPWFGHVMEPADVRAYPDKDATLYRRIVWVVDMAMKYDTTLDGLEAAQTPSSLEPEEMDGVEVYSDMEKMFTDREHFQKSLEMLLSLSAADGGQHSEDPAESAKQLATMLTPEPKRKVSDDAKPLFTAIKNGNFPAASEMLRSQPALVHAQNEDGQTPLYMAVAMDEPDFIVFCHQLGADPNHRDREGWPAIMEAARRHARRSIAALERLRGFNIDCQSKIGWTALMLALSREDFETAETLVDAGASLDVPNVLGLTARQMIPDIPGIPGTLRAKCLHATGHC